ncbi:LysR substrate-binding domain-containing protein [Gordonia humi]|uniref:LysR substrate-binding domain-containing protein n=1 Tax=Gordonia humi TaxID=686429 RepID=UPI003620CAAC
MREFELFRDGMGGTVRIAAIPSAAAVLLPLLVREANERYPGIRIEIMDSLAQVALAGLLNGDVDIAITTSSNLPDSVLYTELLEDRFAVIHCSDHPFTTQKQVTWAELARESLVMFDGNSSIRTLTDAALTEIGASADITAEASSIPVIAGFVSAGIGVAAVPRTCHPTDDGSGHPLNPTRHARRCAPRRYRADSRAIGVPRMHSDRGSAP